MKLTYNAELKQYVVSELGTILHTTPDFYAAQRLAGMEPEPGCDAIDTDTDDNDDFDLSDLFEGTNNV